jgi:hypothetical protein
LRRVWNDDPDASVGIERERLEREPHEAAREGI